MFKRVFVHFIILFVSLFSISVFAGDKKEREFKTIDDCIKAEPSFVFSVSQKEKCKKLIDAFSEETEMVDSSPLGLCRLISGGGAKLASNPKVTLPKGTIIALSEKIGKAEYFPVLDSETSCNAWRERVGGILVVAPVYNHKNTQPQN